MRYQVCHGAPICFYHNTELSVVIGDDTAIENVGTVAVVLDTDKGAKYPATTRERNLQPRMRTQ